MKRILLILLIFCCIDYNAQDLCMSWAARTGSTGIDQGKAIAVDASGNVLTCGDFFGTTDLDPTGGVSNATSAGNSDVFISKLTSTGSFSWARRIGNAGSDVCFGITTDPSGNVYVIGTFTGTVDFDPSASTFNLTSGGGIDFFILKLNSSGNFVWAKRVGGTPSESARSISIDPSGNVYVSGFFSGTNTDFDPGPGTFLLTGSTVGCAFILKLDAAGNFIWAKEFDGVTKDVNGICIKLDATGNSFISGYFGGTVDFDTGPGVFNLTSTSPNYDGFICKLDPSGNFVFVRPFSGPGYIIANALEVHSSGNIYIGGTFSSTLDLDPGPATYTVANGTTFNDAFIVKLDAAGNFLWGHGVGNLTSHDDAMDISINSNGVAYLVGSFNNTVDFDPGPATYTLTSAGATDMYISAYDPSGNFFLAKRIGSTSSDNLSSLEIDASNNMYLTGYISGTVDMDPSNLTYNLTSGGSLDAFMEKLTIVASPTITATGSPSFCSGGSVTLTSSPASGYSWSSGPITQSIAVSTSGNYFVNIFYGSCAVSSNIIPVTAYPLPTITVNSGPICLNDSFTLTPFGASTYTFSSGPVVSPTITTTYSVTGTSSAGCISANAGTGVVTVNPLPIVSLNTGSICSGNSFTLIPGGANTYTFLSAGPVVSPTTSSQYSVVGTSTDGCVSSNTAITTITVNSLPLPTISVSSGTVCYNSMYVYNATGANTYTYSTILNTIYPVANTTYSVYGTDIFGCISVLPGVGEVTVVANPTVAVNSGTLCQGTTFTMIPSGADTYTFSNGSSTISPTGSTLITVIGSNTAGCQASAVSSIAIVAAPIINVNSGNICSGRSFTMFPSGGISFTVVPGNSTIVTPSISTSYAVYGTNALGCVCLSPAISNVNVLPLPNLSVSSGTMCYGTTFSINPVTAFSYTIAGGSNTVSPFMNTSYTVITTDPNGCSRTATSVVSVLPPPNISVASSENPICPGKTATLTVTSSAQTFTWSNASTNTFVVVTPFTTSTYTVVGTDANGCKNSIAMTQTVDFCAGMNELSVRGVDLAMIYPNPSSGNIYLETHSDIDLIITSMMGSTIYSEKIPQGISQLSFAHLPKGVYFVTLTKGSEKQTLKLVLQ